MEGVYEFRMLCYVQNYSTTPRTLWKNKKTRLSAADKYSPPWLAAFCFTTIMHLHRIQSPRRTGGGLVRMNNAILFDRTLNVFSLYNRETH